MHYTFTKEKNKKNNERINKLSTAIIYILPFFTTHILLEVPWSRHIRGDIIHEWLALLDVSASHSNSKEYCLQYSPWL